jgi:hypothetical protein
MPSIEYFVRPFQTANAQGAIIIPSRPIGTRQRATLTWGAKATMPPRTGISFDVLCCKEDLNENTRKSEQKRITNPQDSSMYVDVERPTSLTLKKKSKSTCGDDWDQISGVAQAVDSTLAAFAADVHSGTVASKDSNCNVSWTFKNE